MIELFVHPFSSYCQKALIALYENATPFTQHLIEPGQAAKDELERIWPIGKFPVLREGDHVVFEATAIIEYLALKHPGPVALIPADGEAALQARMLDRFFDNYIGTPQGRIVWDAIRPPEARDPHGVAEARALLDKAYRWLEDHMAGREWAAGEFGLADCAAGPHLFYADWTHPIPADCVNVHAYRARLIARPSFARAIDEARPWRKYFPLGAPDRD